MQFFRVGERILAILLDVKVTKLSKFLNQKKDSRLNKNLCTPAAGHIQVNIIKLQNPTSHKARIP